MSAVLLTPREWGDLLAGLPAPAGQAPALGTIFDLLEVAEAAKKGRGRLSQAEVRQGWEQLLEAGGALAEGQVVVASLDQDVLMQALFETQQGSDGIALWADAVGTERTPGRTANRLILRPLKTGWWDEDAYAELESRADDAGRRDG